MALEITLHKLVRHDLLCKTTLLYLPVKSIIAESQSGAAVSKNQYLKKLN